MNLKRKLLHTSVILAALLLVPAMSALAANPPQPTYDTAVVDGDYGEWDLAEDGSGDFFAYMYRAGNVNMAIESKLYLRYDCSTETMYALVLAVEGMPILVEPLDNAFAKIDGSKVVDGNSASFAWIGQGFDGNNGHAQGWEASFALGPQASYILNVHSNVFADGESQTSAVEDRAIDLTIFCAPEPSAVELASFAAEAQGSDILVTWETASELDNLGFNLYRAESADGPRTKLNSSLITSQGPGSSVGAAYRFVDESVEPGITYHYWLEAVDVSGMTMDYGPVSAQVSPFFGKVFLIRSRRAPVPGLPSSSPGQAPLPILPGF